MLVLNDTIYRGKQSLMENLDRRTESQILLGQLKSRLMSNLKPTDFLDAPMLYLDRQMVALLLSRVELFQKILSIQGSIVECGVYKANSLMTYFHLSNILEPFNFNRKIIGFDTFSGFPSISESNDPDVDLGYLSEGVFYERINEFISLQEQDKAVSHIRKIELVKGDATKTIPKYIEDNPHLIISLLYLDFDLFEPTKLALEQLLPLVPRGGIVGFDQLNQKKWKGETKALKTVLRMNDIDLRRILFDSHVSYFEVT